MPSKLSGVDGHKTAILKSMRQAIELTGPGASLEELAVALGVTPERQAAIRGILGPQLQGKSSRNGSEHKLSPNRASKKKTAPRK